MPESLNPKNFRTHYVWIQVTICLLFCMLFSEIKHRSKGVSFPEAFLVFSPALNTHPVRSFSAYLCDTCVISRCNPCTRLLVWIFYTLFNNLVGLCCPVKICCSVDEVEFGDWNPNNFNHVSLTFIYCVWHFQKTCSSFKNNIKYSSLKLPGSK